MKTKTKSRPWLNSNEKPICDSTLKRISKNWDADTWEDYLTWFQTPCKEALLRGRGYALKCEEMTETVYREYGHEHDELIAKYVDGLLGSLPKNQATVLRLYYFEGLTERQVSRRMRITHQCVNVRKRKALFSLAQTNPEENVAAIHIMRGLFSSKERKEPLEQDPVEDQYCEERTCDPEAFDSEIQAIENANVKRAIAELTENQKRAVYLRYWCDLSFSEIARRLGVGVSSVQALCDVSVSKIKRRATELNEAQSKEKVKTAPSPQPQVEEMTQILEVSSCA